MNAGKYTAVASGKCVLGESKEKGTPFIELYFSIVEGPCTGESVRWTTYFTDKMAEMSIKALQTMGWAGDDMSEFSDGDLHGLDANRVQIVVEMEAFKGRDGTEKTAPRVRWVNALGAPGVSATPMSQDKVGAFGEAMRARVIALKEKREGTDFEFGANTVPAKAAPPKAAF